MELKKRMAIERKVVRRLIRVAKKNGYALNRIWDGECNERPVKESEIMDVVFSVDECKMYFRHPEEQSSQVAVIVLGNDGYDCIADCSVGERWNEVMMLVDKYAGKFE